MCPGADLRGSTKNTQLTTTFTSLPQNLLETQGFWEDIRTELQEFYRILNPIPEAVDDDPYEYEPYMI